MKEIGFLLWSSAFEEIRKGKIQFDNIPHSFLKENLLKALKLFPNYNSTLQTWGVSEEDFEEALFFFSIITDLDSPDFNSLKEYYFYIQFSEILKEYPFLKPAIYLAATQINSLSKLNLWFSFFLDDATSNADYFDFLTQTDMNYDSFLVPENEIGKLSSDLLKVLDSNVVSQINLPSLNLETLIIKRWR